MRITSFGLIKDLADEVDQTLHLIGVPGLLAFDDDSCANDAVDTVFCTCQNDQSGLIGRRRVTVYADSRENQLVKMVADEWW